MSSLSVLQRKGMFGSVVVVTGHMTDAPDRATPRFPEAEVARVRTQVTALFRNWKLGANDLVICGAARGGDLIAATAAHELGATVWALLARDPVEFEGSSVAGSDPAWTTEFWQLLHRSPSWCVDQLRKFDRRDDIYAATNEWMLDTATQQASGAHLRLLAIWDGTDAGGTGGAAHMVHEARRRNAVIEVIDPRPSHL
jgi:hypothetical protein